MTDPDWWARATGVGGLGLGLYNVAYPIFARHRERAGAPVRRAGQVRLWLETREVGKWPHVFDHIGAKICNESELALTDIRMLVTSRLRPPLEPRVELESVALLERSVTAQREVPAEVNGTLLYFSRRTSLGIPADHMIRFLTLEATFSNQDGAWHMTAGSAPEKL